MTPDQLQQLAVLWPAVRAAERGPDAADLAAAPVLDDWRPMRAAGGMVLWGEVSGHPRLGQAHVVTSRLLALDRSAG